MIADAFLSEFEHEAKTTRRFLERVPADRLDWRPHPKSMTVGQLALHIASVPGGIASAATQDSIPAPDFSKGMPQPATLDEVLAAHDASVATVRKVLPTIGDHRMGGTWTATAPDGKPVMSMPRSGVIRMIMLNHWIQHRGQLGVYLRLLGAKVPYSYGPSGDESPFGG
ncbi:MAG TPA: DinB family protein [Humisphaera sp.]